MGWMDGCMHEHTDVHVTRTFQPGNLPERDSIGVGLASLAHQEGSVPGHPHQHVLGLGPGEVGMVPPLGKDSMILASARVPDTRS